MQSGGTCWKQEPQDIRLLGTVSSTPEAVSPPPEMWQTNNPKCVHDPGVLKTSSTLFALHPTCWETPGAEAGGPPLGHGVGLVFAKRLTVKFQEEVSRLHTGVERGDGGSGWGVACGLIQSCIVSESQIHFIFFCTCYICVSKWYVVFPLKSWRNADAPGGCAGAHRVSQMCSPRWGRLSWETWKHKTGSIHVGTSLSG